jgi:hypothetical protein
MAILNMDEEALLAEICKKHDVPQMVLTELLELERDLFGMGRRHGLYEKIGEILENAVAKEE